MERLVSGALSRGKILRDLFKPIFTLSKRIEQLHQESGAKGAPVDLVSKRNPLELNTHLTKLLAQDPKIYVPLPHQALEVGNEGLLPIFFAKALRHFVKTPTDHSSSYLMTNDLARGAHSRYNVIKYDDDETPMPQHFLKSARAKTLSVKSVMRMSEEEAYAEFRRLRWPDTDGQPVCPHCGYDHCYDIRTRRIFKCAACRKQFSVTSGTLFNSAKLEYRDYLAVIALFVNAAKGISALQISRDMGISYKAAFVLLHKLREAIEDSRGNMKLEGEVEIDGAYYGGHVRPPNSGREGKRPAVKSRKLCVLTLVRRAGGTVPLVVPTENTEVVLAAAAKHILPGSRIFADEHGAYDALHARYETYRINHRYSYSDGVACTNAAESFHSRMRRAEIGQYHRISDRFLQRYAFETAYRSDRRQTDNGAIFAELGEMALGHPVSRQWKGYWQARS